MALPQSDFNLSDDELKSIALMHSNWAAAETLLGMLLAHCLSVSTRAAKLLIHPLDGKKKVGYLWQIRSEHELLGENEALLQQAMYAFEKYRGERNIYSHGLIVTGEDGSRVAASLKGVETHIDELPLALEKSRFALVVVGRLFAAVNGDPIREELPGRPA